MAQHSVKEHLIDESHVDVGEKRKRGREEEGEKMKRGREEEREKESEGRKGRKGEEIKRWPGSLDV